MNEGNMNEGNMNEGNKVSSLVFTTFVVFGLLLEKNAEVYKC
jgi:hypothetical protein